MERAVTLHIGSAPATLAPPRAGGDCWPACPPGDRFRGSVVWLVHAAAPCTLPNPASTHRSSASPPTPAPRRGSRRTPPPSRPFRAACARDSFPARVAAIDQIPEAPVGSAIAPANSVHNAEALRCAARLLVPDKAER